MEGDTLSLMADDVFCHPVVLSSPPDGQQRWEGHRRGREGWGAVSGLPVASSASPESKSLFPFL